MVQWGTNIETHWPKPNAKYLQSSVLPSDIWNRSQKARYMMTNTPNLTCTGMHVQGCMECRFGGGHGTTVRAQPPTTGPLSGQECLQIALPNLYTSCPWLVLSYGSGNWHWEAGMHPCARLPDSKGGANMPYGML